MAAERKYTIESVLKALLVVEALEGTSFEPVPMKRIMARTKFNRNLTMRLLKTLEEAGWASQNDRGEWTIGRRFIRFAAKAAENEV